MTSRKCHLITSVLDEIGRGTSTIDGLSIAWAVVEYISNPKILGAKTLFATHYHELTELEGKLSNVNNYCIAVKEKGDDIVFLRKIVSGGADRSYGIQVAKLAGVPDPVIERAKVICEELERANMSNLAANLPEIPTQHKAKQKHPDDPFYNRLLADSIPQASAKITLCIVEPAVFQHIFPLEIGRAHV